MRILFTLKRREGYWGGSDLSSGLRNSVTFVTQMLRQNGIPAFLEQVEDNNKIDAAIHFYKPTDVILEAFWVVPSKLDVLMPLHPTVKFSVRNHSEMAFLQHEGIAMEWINGYLQRGIEVMSNSPRAVEDVKTIARAYGHDPRLSTYAPNWYPLNRFRLLPPDEDNPVLRVACFGAIRPLKNHLAQAIAAIKFAQALRMPLEFHVNATRIEGRGDPIIKNLRALFAQSPDAQLIEQPWMPHDEFRQLLATMHYSLQCSFSETFNVVTADATAEHVPVIGSAQIPWLPASHCADPNDAEDIYRALLMAERRRHHIQWMYDPWFGLWEYCQMAEANWLQRYQ